MNCMVHIGSVIDKKTRESLSRLIDSVLKSCHVHQATEGTSIKALDLCRDVFETKGVTITNSIFNGSMQRADKKKKSKKNKKK